LTPLAKLLEAALFASARPIPAEELATLDPESSPAAVAAALDELREHYDVDGHGVELAELGGGWQILTRAEYTEAIERAQLAARPQRLSAAALETLAIIAYRQPIGRGEIEEIRGVAVGGVLKSLHERGLIDVTGRAEGLGRPLLYGTTPLFLEHFALRHLEELPRADELAIALRVQGKTAIDPSPVEDEPAPARSNGRSGRSTKKERDAAAAPELPTAPAADVAVAELPEVVDATGEDLQDVDVDAEDSPDAARPTPDEQ
jgi:segregation and condensation protein B